MSVRSHAYTQSHQCNYLIGRLAYNILQCIPIRVIRTYLAEGNFIVRKVYLGWKLGHKLYDLMT
jgi:hypothetical protein